MTWTVVRAVDDALMCADWLPLGDDLEAIRIDAQADSAIGERGRYAVAIALKVDGDCQDFRVWPGIMGNKESHYVTTQRTCHTE